MSRVEEPGGKIRSITYDSYGNITSVKDNNGIGYTFSFDYDKGRREYYAFYVDADGVSKELWYDRKGRKVREDHNGITVNSIIRDGRTSWTTDAQGNITRKESDEHYNLTRMVYPDETWVEHEYAQPWNQLVQTNRMGVITAYEYDNDGYLSARVDAKDTNVARRTEFTYSDSGKLLTATIINETGDNAVTTYTYDEHDNIATVTDPEDRVTRFPDYDAAGNPLTIEDGRSYQKHLEYDAAGNIRYVRDNNNELLNEFRYDDAGNRSSSINALLKEFKFSYDANGRLLETEDPYGNKRLNTYTFAGKIALVEDEEHLKTRREYDSFGRLAKSIDGVGNEISYEYSQGGCSSCGSGSRLVSRIVYPTFSREMEYDKRRRVIL